MACVRCLFVALFLALSMVSHIPSPPISDNRIVSKWAFCFLLAFLSALFLKAFRHMMNSHYRICFTALVLRFHAPPWFHVPPISDNLIWGVVCKCLNAFPRFSRTWRIHTIECFILTLWSFSHTSCMVTIYLIVKMTFIFFHGIGTKICNDFSLFEANLTIKINTYKVLILPTNERKYIDTYRRVPRVEAMIFRFWGPF